MQKFIDFFAVFSFRGTLRDLNGYYERGEKRRKQKTNEHLALRTFLFRRGAGDVNIKVICRNRSGFKSLKSETVGQDFKSVSR